MGVQSCVQHSNIVRDWLVENELQLAFNVDLQLVEIKENSIKCIGILRLDFEKQIC
jgi:hypothetical protein